MTSATMTAAGKLQQLIPLIVRNPNEFVDRVRAKLEVRADRRHAGQYPYRPHVLADAFTLLESELGLAVQGILDEVAFDVIRAHVIKGTSRVRGPISSVHNGDLSLGAIVYAVCRAMQPRVVVETGVAHGVTSAFLLQALACNGKGELWSVDLPPLGRDAEAHVGTLVPANLRSGWHLRRGVSRRLLPGILRAVGTVDIFIHDSLHTHSNMWWEFETVWPMLRPGGLLIADDIENNAAFGEFAEKVAPSGALVIQEQGKRGSLLGILRKAD